MPCTCDCRPARGTSEEQTVALSRRPRRDKGCHQLCFRRPTDYLPSGACVGSVRITA